MVAMQLALHLPRAVLVLAPMAGALLASPQDEERRLTPAQVEEDLFQLSEVLASQHAGFHRYATPQELDEAFGEALFELAEGSDLLDFFRVTSRLIARVGCGHTEVSLPQARRTAALERRGLLPLEVLIRGERVYVLKSLGADEEFVPGDELLSIDGLSMPHLRERAFAGMAADGFIESGKERRLERQFARLYTLLVDEQARGPYRFEVAGREEVLEVDGLSARDYRVARDPAPDRPLVALELWEDESLGVLTVSEFDDGPRVAFPGLLAKRFRRLAQAEVKNLVLDLRGNGGGEDMYGALLVSYLAPEPFRYFERIEVTPDYDMEGETLWRDGTRLMLSHPGLERQAPAENRFEGRVFVLIDGWTFSTAADVATVLHHNGWATFVGEETGGGYDGNTSGVSRSVTLAHSGLSIDVPRWMYVTANVGHAHRGRGVPPDHAVAGTLEDALAGRDAQLAKVRALIRSN